MDMNFDDAVKLFRERVGAGYTLFPCPKDEVIVFEHEVFGFTGENASGSRRR